MMGIEPGALVVILLYAVALAVILFVSPKLVAPAAARPPWWRNVRFWASLVAVQTVSPSPGEGRKMVSILFRGHTIRREPESALIPSSVIAEIEMRG
jgi:hypothetical protein